MDRHDIVEALWSSLLKSRLAGLGVQGFLLNPEDHKFRRLYGSDADQTDQSPVVDIVLSHRGAVAFHEERLVGFCPLQGTTSPGGGQEIRDCLPNACPERLVVGFE